ncbi:MAG: TIGR01212 family radical SAM protein [Bacilli bacterium]|nr:TIGR01212 family radical SAM protein [Bacilli bacterium]
MFKYSNDNKRYHTFNYYLRNKFNSKVFKIPIDAHASCPNKLTGGCIYCKDNSKSNITDNSLSLFEQYKQEVEILNRKWPDAKHIIYFQTGTNTYMPLETFKKNIEPFLNVPEIVGISVATRSDALTDDYIEYFKQLNKKTFLTIELGLQSSKNETLKLINRGHDMQNFIAATKKLKNNNIFVVAHIINGLPFETKEDMLNTVEELNQLNIDGIKIHMLHILKDTPLEKLYNETNFHILSKEEYIDIVIDQLEILKPEVVIERITGDPIIEDLITPTWLTKKFILLNDIDKEMVKRNTYQGKKNN